MALHDLGETELCTKEACHKLAWTLDACLKVKGILPDPTVRSMCVIIPAGFAAATSLPQHWAPAVRRSSIAMCCPTGCQRLLPQPGLLVPCAFNALFRTTACSWNPHVLVQLETTLYSTNCRPESWTNAFY